MDEGSGDGDEQLESIEFARGPKPLGRRMSSGVMGDGVGLLRPEFGHLTAILLRGAKRLGRFFFVEKIVETRLISLLERALPMLNVNELRVGER